MKVLKKVLLMLVSVALTVSFAACDVSTPGEQIKITDNRPMAYAVRSAEDDSVLKEFNSMYTAMYYAVNECDYGDYVTKLNGDDNDVPLFVNRDKFDDASKDMFYYYENGVSLDTYTQWTDSYWSDMQKNGGTTVFLSGEGLGLRPYFQAHKLVSATTKEGTAYNPARDFKTYNIQKFVDSQIIVNLPTYSGITKVEYEISLKDAELYPSRNLEQNVVATVGFTVPDAYNVSHMGLLCDLKTGNWHYYNGEFDIEDSASSGAERNIESKVLMTSVWNSEKECWIPSENIKLTCEILTIKEGGDEYIVDRLTMKFLDSGKTEVRDYEYSSLTQCGTLRFVATLDILEDGQPDFMNGAQFKNLVVTSAKGTVLQEMLSVANYGGELSAIRTAGVYDLLNSNPQTDARCATVLYNPSIITCDFGTSNRDVYNFSYKLDTSAPAYSSNIKTMIQLLEAIPAIGDLVESDLITKILPAATYLLGLSEYQIGAYHNQEYLLGLISHMEAATAALT